MLRLRVTELMKGMTPYELSKRSGGRISMSAAYRLTADKAKPQTFNAAMLEALLDVFGVGIEDLIERVPEKRGKGR
jgi:DNA-binding Xre family transcriptional regulator